MTFDADVHAANHERSMKYDLPIVHPSRKEDDTDSAGSADISVASKQPFNKY